MDPAIPTRPPVFIHSLTNLPRELVHKVLDDLPVEKILQIISHKIAYLDSCVTSHFRYGRMFRSQTDINSVVDYYILFRDMKRWHRASLSFDYSLENTITSAGRTYEAVLRDYLFSRIQAYSELPAIEVKVLKPWASGPYPELRGSDPLPKFWARWDWVKTARENLNTERAANWTKAADLITTYPGKIMLKKPLDPDQSAPRPNVAHIANRLRATAKKISQDHTLFYKFSSCGYVVDGIILVPYNRHLWSFLEVIRNCPPDSRSKTLEDLKDLSISNAKEHIEDNTKQGSFIYPEEIAMSLKVVMEGLAQIYTGSPLRIIPRISWPVIPPAGGIAKPTFFVNHAQFADMHLCPRKRRTPHDPRELEWLEAFLKVVTWMEENMEVLKKEMV